MKRKLKALPLQGFCQVKKIEKSEKNSEVVGGSSRNSDFYFFGEILCFFCVSCVVFMFPTVSKKIQKIR